MELGTDNSQYGGYITRLWKCMNSYWMFWIHVGGLLWKFSVSSFCDFWKITFWDFTKCFSFLAKATLWFSDLFHEENYSLSISKTPNMIDFSECRSEEVIRFFWCSVYEYYWLNITPGSLDLSVPLLFSGEMFTSSKLLTETNKCFV